MGAELPVPRAGIEGEQLLVLDSGWAAVATAPDQFEHPNALAELGWSPARVPGTAAVVAENRNDGFDAEDWWFRTCFEAAPAAVGEEVALELDGIATVSEVFLNGERILASDSMFAEHTVDVGQVLEGNNELAIRCRALAPLLAERRRPRARWRTRVVREGNLRFFRTMILGRAPGFAPGPAAVGPWRPVRLRRRRGFALDELTLRTGLEGEDGLLRVSTRIRGIGEPAPGTIEIELDGPSGTHREALRVVVEAEGVASASGELRVPRVARWWPHTHGEPALHHVKLIIGTGAGQRSIDAGSVGFRSLAAGPEPEHDFEESGLRLQVNGVDVFARGAVWTPVDWRGLAPSEAELRETVETAREAGMNVLRIPGTAAYEAPAFHDLCDELGMMVWQDFMFANLDYPVADEGFRALVESEAAQVTARLASRPSTVVLCGNSEVEQQAAMFGVDPRLGRGELFGELLPRIIEEAGADAVYVPSAPSGGELPFRPDRGVANYFGVGGYRRPLEDARRAEVRFAAECLAFANVPDDGTLDELFHGHPGELAVHHPAWKAGVPRDVGTGWDFDDVRDHYLQLLFDLDPLELRSVDPRRYFELARATSGETMAEVLGEWRRRRSSCAGAIVLWLRDLVPGAGWGLIDSRGGPKVAYHHLRRALAPVAVWTTDEGLGGIAVHVANDRPEPLSARLRVSLYRDHEQRTADAAELIEVAPHEGIERNVEGMLGHFVDAAWAYRFGPPAQDVVVATLESTNGVKTISQAFRFPAGRPTRSEPAARLGLEGSATALEGGEIGVEIGSRRLAYGVRVVADGFTPSDDAFSIEPAGERAIILRPRATEVTFEGAVVTALNLDGSIRITTEERGR